MEPITGRLVEREIPPRHAGATSGHTRQAGRDTRLERILGCLRQRTHLAGDRRLAGSRRRSGEERSAGRPELVAAEAHSHCANPGRAHAGPPGGQPWGNRMVFGLRAGDPAGSCLRPPPALSLRIAGSTACQSRPLNIYCDVVTGDENMAVTEQSQPVTTPSAKKKQVSQSYWSLVWWKF